MLMGLDVAVEFATLGEFRLVDPALAAATPAEATAAAPLVRRPPRKAAIPTNTTILPGPATALGRAMQPVPAPAHAPVRLEHATRRRGGQPPAQPTRRTRAGAVEPSAQLCLAV
jgi:hypothetical protein